MNFGFLLIPIFFVALVIWVAWPLLADAPPVKPPVKATDGRAKKKQGRRRASND